MDATAHEVKPEPRKVRLVNLCPDEERYTYSVMLFDEVPPVLVCHVRYHDRADSTSIEIVAGRQFPISATVLDLDAWARMTIQRHKQQTLAGVA